ncbi:unnamed protein product [Phytophthora fragariaefolia]|uniref:Unnamed protein product n=1 Tax=Phytophthora fragariaefolia TaxID=1490495 RepID=A0A9W7CPW2_9STRA|nr:unnamed protein product [Phytophthora fragariaefolia]
MFDQAMVVFQRITADTVRNAFEKAGPYFGRTTSTDVQGMLDEFNMLNEVDVQDNDSATVRGVIGGEMEQFSMQVSL